MRISDFMVPLGRGHKGYFRISCNTVFTHIYAVFRLIISCHILKSTNFLQTPNTVPISIVFGYCDTS